MTLELKNVFFDIGKENILEDVNLNIKKNDFVGIIGPNGGGKTTLLKLLLGLIEPTKGTISIFNKKPHDMLGKIGYVPQKAEIDKDFPINVLDLVILGATNKNTIFFSRKTKQKAIYLLKKLDLYHKREQSLGFLSGGEMQKALIARALINNPEILILDEPTSNIDKKSERNIFDFLLQDLGEKTILLVSHDLEMIIKKVGKIIFVQRKVNEKLPETVCEHFALGLYHEPLNKKIDNKNNE